MGYFDTNSDGTVNFDEFLVGLRVRYELLFIINRAK